MLERNQQEVSNAKNSLVQQANGNIYNSGLGYDDVKGICLDVCRREFAIVTKDAHDLLLGEVNVFLTRFFELLEELEMPQLLERLRSPKLQFSLHDVLAGFAKTDDSNTKDELVSLFIDRLKVEENSVEQFLIDESIKVLPKITLQQAYFLGALTLRKLTKRGLSLAVQNYLRDQGAIYQYLDMITLLDIQYLKLVNCCSNLPGLTTFISIIEDIKTKHDLYFRHPISKESLNTFLEKYKSIPVLGGYQIIYTDEESNNYYLLYNSKDFLIKQFEIVNNADKIPIVEHLIDLFLPFTDDEIKQHLNSLNVNWQKAFDCLDKKEISSIDLTPLGTYIGNRISQKVATKDTLPLQEFYKYK